MKGFVMEVCILWMDSEHAKIFKVSENGVHKEHLDLKNLVHSHSGKYIFHKKNSQEIFFSRLAEMCNFGELIIFGPGVAKNHFKSHLELHHKDIFKRIIAFEPMDHLSDNQILERSREFFKHYNIFNHP